MRFSLFASFAVCAAFAVGAASIPANPIVERYPADVLFYLGWNASTVQPDIGRARSDKHTASIDPNGVIGTCYAGGGVVTYTPLEPSVRLVDTTKPGTLTIWVKYLEPREPILKKNGRWEPGFGILTATGGEGQALFLMKSSDCRWGGGTIKIHHQGRDAAGKTISGGACGFRSPFVEWQPDVWRFVVASWSIDKLRISINGEPFRETPLKTALGDLTGRLFLKADARTRLDELVVLGRALSNDEVKTIYESFAPHIAH